MNLIFMRHGEATDNVREVISDKEIYWSVLTEQGKASVLESLEGLPAVIDKIYVSPFPRTIQTAHYVFLKYPKTEVVIENRLHEINNGKYSGKKNNDDLDQTRIKQIQGDYFVRFGEYGENKFDIETRLCEFLYDVYTNNFCDNTILIVSHGSITSYMKRILNIKTPHIKTGKIEEFVHVDFQPLFEYMEVLEKVKDTKIKERVQLIRSLNIRESFKNTLIKMVKKEFNNIELSDYVFLNFINGLQSTNLKLIEPSHFEKGVILVCFYHNFECFAEKWINHYIDIGIRNFVLVDNHSTDCSTEILKKYSETVHISFWSIHENFDCYKMCGWKQQILEYYGVGQQYLMVDSDELFIYENYQNISFEDYLKKNPIPFIKSLMLDVYTNKKLFDGTLEDFKYVDRGTYKISTNVSYYEKLYGGPRYRVFGMCSSLQKIPFVSYTGNEIFIDQHYCYPWNLNKEARLCSYLLHYEFLFENRKNYCLCTEKKQHISQSDPISFFDKDISIPIDKIDFKF